jgi:two-component system LytT family response regulator
MSTMIYKCIIADDNAVELHMLRVFLQKISSIEITAECENGVDVAAILTDQHIDIVFSDIDMPDLDGVALLKSLRNPPVFIFVTSFENYALESWNLNVIDFILKPVKFERLAQAVNKAIEYLQLKAILNSQKIPAATETAASDIYADDHFFIKETKGITRLKYSEVLFIESLGDFSKIMTVHNSTHIVLAGLKNVLEQLPATIFKRVHKQYVVNLNQIHTITSTDVHFCSPQTVPVSSLYKQNLLDAFLKKDIIKRKSD